MTDEAKLIVNTLRECAVATQCSKCVLFCGSDECLFTAAAKMIEYYYDKAEHFERNCEGLNLMLTNTQTALEQVKRERDAAVEDLKGLCGMCAHWNHGFMEDACEECIYSKPFDDDTFEPDNWQWRGVKEG